MANTQILKHCTWSLLNPLGHCTSTAPGPAPEINDNGNVVLVAHVLVGDSKDKLVESLLSNSQVRVCLLGADVVAGVVVETCAAADKDLGLSSFVLVLVRDIDRDDNILGVAVVALDQLDEVVAKLVVASMRLVELAVDSLLELIMAVDNIVALVVVTCVGVRFDAEVLQGTRVQTIDAVSLDDLALALGKVSVVELGISLRLALALLLVEFVDELVGSLLSSLFHNLLDLGIAVDLSTLAVLGLSDVDSLSGGVESLINVGDGLGGGIDGSSSGSLSLGSVGGFGSDIGGLRSGIDSSLGDVVSLGRLTSHEPHQSLGLGGISSLGSGVGSLSGVLGILAHKQSHESVDSLCRDSISSRGSVIGSSGAVGGCRNILSVGHLALVILLILAIRILSHIFQIKDSNDSLSDVLVNNPGEKLLNLGDSVLNLLLIRVLTKSINGLCEDLVSSLEDMLGSFVDVLLNLISRRLLDTVDLGDVGDSLLEVLGDDVLDSSLNLVDKLDDGASRRVITSRVDGLVDGLADTLVDSVLGLLNVLLDLGGVDLYCLVSMIVLGQSRALEAGMLVERRVLVKMNRSFSQVE
ncbi:hypothetical protein HG531_012596 [Fusarium graminearum]|nr:hypothetical protein HG531_012596 [Fusarium graminearum]